jgi:hypothetical protein
MLSTVTSAPLITQIALPAQARSRMCASPAGASRIRWLARQIAQSTYSPGSMRTVSPSWATAAASLGACRLRCGPTRSTSALTPGEQATIQPRPRSRKRHRRRLPAASADVSGPGLESKRPLVKSDDT